MKKLEKQFVSNNDKVGNNNFELVRRQGNVAIYHRTDMNGNHRSYEVFIVNVVKAGASLPGGGTVKETYEQYPGSAQFGRTAYDCKTLERAEERFDELCKKVMEREQAAEDDRKNGVVRRRGRRSKTTKVNVVMPSKGSRFNMKMLIAETGLTQPRIYPMVKQWLSDGLISVVESVKSETGRGRPSLVYVVN